MLQKQSYPVRGLLWAVLFAGLMTACWGKACKDCPNNYIYPNLCSSRNGTAESRLQSGECEGDACCPLSTCCTPTAVTCSLNNQTCCTWGQSMCLVSQVYTSVRLANGSFASVCSTPSNWNTWTCPPNYLPQRTSGSSNGNNNQYKSGFCIASNCMTVSGFDCTKCQACFNGFRFVADGSCQALPTIQGTLLSVRQDVSSLVTNSEVLSLSTDPGRATALVSVSLTAQANGMRSGVSATATLASGRCVLTAGTSTASSSTFATFASSPVSVSVSPTVTATLGTSVLSCTATDSNNLTVTVNKTITVTDNQPPVITCVNQPIVTGPSRAFAVYNWSTNATATDNVGVLGWFCRGGPNNNSFAAGTVTTISCQAWDARFNSSCSYNITATDNAPANITCPASVRINTTAGQGFGTTTYSPTAVDNVGLTAGPTCIPATGSLFPAWSSTTVTCTAKDAANPAVSCTFLVNVTDFEVPKITCPGGLTINTAAAGGTTALGSLAISASDNAYLASVTCGSQPVTLSGSTTAAQALISNTFPLGTTGITCTALDQRGNSASCSTSVTVADTTPPVILCTSSALTTAQGSNFSLLPGGYAVSATDNVNVTGISCTPSNNASRQFPFGTTSVTCTAADTAGNTASCNLIVTVTDGQAPTVQCPINTLAVATNLTGNISIAIPALNATDNVQVWNTSITVVENQNSSLTRVYTGSARTIIVSQPWPVMVTFQATDTSGNTAACSFGVSVYPAAQPLDTTPPVIYNCPTSFVYSTIPSSDFNSPMYNSSVYLYNITTLSTKRFGTLGWTALNATDNSGFVTMGYLDWSPNPSIAALGLAAGRYVVAYGATDRQGNSVYCAFRIVVRDVEAPTWLRCSENQNYLTGSNAGGYVDSWPTGGMFAVDNVNVPVPEGTCSSVPAGYCPSTAGQAPTRLFPVGTVQFEYTAVDGAGNAAAACRFNVTVVDNWRPTIPSCSSVAGTQFIDVSTSAGLATADISRLCPVLAPVDNIGVTGLSYSSTPAGFNCTTPIGLGSGLTLITATARDAAGLVSDACFIVVTVSDNEPPVLTGCPSVGSVIVRNCTAGQATAQITLPAIGATDNSGIVTLTTTPAGFMGGQTYAFGLGLTAITFAAKDASNSPVECTVQMQVVDTERPVISGFPGSPNTTFSLTLATDASQPTATYTLPNIVATDNVGLTSFGFDLAGFVAGGTYALPIGTTTLTYLAQDASFNQASVTLTVVVEDREQPVSSGCPSVNASNPVTLAYNTSEGQATRIVSWNITAADNSRRRVLTYQQSHPVGYSRDSPFPIGTTTITMTAVDGSGNSQVCAFDVRVVDTKPPTVQCPSHFTVTTATAQDSAAAVAWFDPIVVDNSGGSVRVNVSMNTGNYSQGLYNVTVIALDPSDNAASCNFSFTVLQMQAAATPSSSDASTGAAVAGGAGGGIALLALLAIIVLVVIRRNHNKKLQAASSGYAELMAMSDEFVLERARAIQQALVDQRASDPPAAVNAQFVHPTRKFAAPPTELGALEAYIRDMVRKEISRDSLEFGPELGSGEFGAVYRGEHSATDVEAGASSKQTVAIKMLKNSTAVDDRVRFLKEAAIMAQFNHPNIVSLVGVCLLPDSEPTLIVLAYMHLGSLHGYLQCPMVKDQLETLTMLRMALDVGSAMQYLAEAGFVHRDLAARNVLLDENMNCHVGDFGLSVDLSASNDGEGGIYSGDEGAKIPVRWTSLEAICFRQFSSASDVWSFGVMLWEIWSYAEMPYKGWNNKKVTEQVTDGYRLPKPPTCPDEVYRIMIDCWNKNVQRRATFNKINLALVQAWKDIAKETMGGDGADNGNLYDTGDDDAAAPVQTGTRPGAAGAAGMALYDTGDDDGAAPVQTGTRPGAVGMALYDTGDDDGAGSAAAKRTTEALYDVGDDDNDGAGKAAAPVKAQAKRVTEALYDTGDEEGTGGALLHSGSSSVRSAAKDNSAAVTRQATRRANGDGGYLSVGAEAELP